MIFPSENVCDIHHVIIDDHRKIVGRKSIGFNYYEVREVLILKGHLTL